MQHYIDSDKKAIKNLDVFSGLAVDNSDRWRNEFLKEKYSLIVVPNYMNKENGYVIFSVESNSFVFWLINFTGATGRAAVASKITETILKKIAGPICKERSIEFIKCTVERLGMARKLEAFGFTNQKGTNIFIGAAENVF